jgi:hypothetical protein
MNRWDKTEGGRRMTWQKEDAKDNAFGRMTASRSDRK